MKTQAAQAAQEIRKVLRGVFPEIKFRVNSQTYAGGDSVSINYVNGVPSAEVEKWVKGFQCGKFNSMEDIYEYSDNVEGRPQAKYIMVSREISNDKREEAKRKIAEKFGIEQIENEQEWYNKTGEWSDIRILRELRNQILN